MSEEKTQIDILIKKLNHYSSAILEQYSKAHNPENIRDFLNRRGLIIKILSKMNLEKSQIEEINNQSNNFENQITDLLHQDLSATELSINQIKIKKVKLYSYLEQTT